MRVVLSTGGWWLVFSEELCLVNDGIGISKSISQAFIYGSFAKGDEREDSDIDLLIIGKVGEDKLIEEIDRLERKLQREINYAIYEKEDFNKKKKEGNSFILDILKEKKIFLIGDEERML